ncbi:FkbM family methyltransferase [Priestia megaterium]|uniref:FkbM family methyltransferase n=1 Tax=Priestia megaterium TaxID=1404 RepID=UPI000BF43778|nr:FkbM family methyltransferase [Priestia megaterium]PFI91797.1 hypothetical protein COI84_20960 [Priestia megaterium]PGR14196.1 hypothetical protein COC62_06280 [Priestia megaterium]
MTPTTIMDIELLEFIFLPTSIDNLVKETHIPKIDFIKVDIEGTEINTLKGTIEIIQAFFSKLTTAIHHQIKDFANVVNFIEDLNLGYKFYPGHYRIIYAQKTILFAVPK